MSISEIIDKYLNEESSSVSFKTDKGWMSIDSDDNPELLSLYKKIDSIDDIIREIMGHRDFSKISKKETSQMIKLVDKMKFKLLKLN